MGRKAGMVHAMSSNVRLFNGFASDIMPEVDIVHLVDEGLPSLSDAPSRPLAIRRLKALASFAEESGAEAVMLTCTAFGRLVAEVQEAVKVPVLSVLEIVTDEAIALGDQIGILGTHPGTLATATQIIQEEAALRGKKIEVKTLLCAGAFDAIRREDWATHDRIVLEHLNKLMAEVKVIVIPQPSIERVLKQLPEASRKVPILSSGHLSVRRLKETLDSLQSVNQSS